MVTRRRLQLAVGAGVAVAVLVAVVLLTRGGTTDPRPGVPDRLYGVPAHLGEQDDDGSWRSDEVSDDLAVGPGAVAFVTTEGLPVVVDAEDGTYHLLDLPDFAGELVGPARTEGADLGLALSPDGRRLAFAYADVDPDDPDGRPSTSGVRVLDLTTGQVVREVAIDRLHGTVVDQVVWSLDGRWLALTGDAVTSWVDPDADSDRFVARIGPGADAVEEVDPVDTHEQGDVSIADDGRVVVTRNARLVSWTDRVVASPEAPVDRTPLTVSVSPDGSRLAVAERGGSTLLLLDPTTAAVRSRIETPGGIDVLGWIDDGTVLVTAGSRLCLATANGVREVGRLEEGDDRVPRELSVATVLVTADRPTVERPAPRFSWSTERVLSVTAFILLVLALGLGLAWQTGRRRDPGHVAAPRAVRFCGGAAAAAALVVGWSFFCASGLRLDATLAPVWIGGATLLGLTALALAVRRGSRAFWVGVAVGTPVTVVVEGLVVVALLLDRLE